MMVRCEVYAAVVLMLLGSIAHVSALGNHLTVDWTTGEVHSPMAKTIQAHQSVCTDKVYYYHHNNWGMGSDLHTWTQAVCNSMEKGATLLEVPDGWIWNDRTFCHTGPTLPKVQPLSCYFNLDKHCPESTTFPDKMMSYNHSYDRCPKYIQDDRTRQIFRASAIEYLFSNMSKRLIAEAEKEIHGVFGSDGIPENMITVHLRWGDKKREMKLVTQQEYVDAIDKMVRDHAIAHPHVYITTESKEALEKIEQYVKQHKPKWKLYNYAPSVYDDRIPTPRNHGPRHAIHGANAVASPMKMAQNTGGVQGKASIIALLFALESKYYVLTSGSNWSRIIDELRRTTIDHRCGNCTKMVDLREGFAEHNWRRLENLLF